MKITKYQEHELDEFIDAVFSEFVDMADDCDISRHKAISKFFQRAGAMVHLSHMEQGLNLEQSKKIMIKIIEKQFKDGSLK